jgi:hypothetical protein
MRHWQAGTQGQEAGTAGNCTAGWASRRAVIGAHQAFMVGNGQLLPTRLPGAPHTFAVKPTLAQVR